MDKYCRSCLVLQATKTDNQRPKGLLHSMLILTRPWGSITMDFVGPFPPSEGFDYMWVVLCRLTSMVHLVPVTMTIRALQLACLYVKEIVRLHGLPETIVSDRDAKFTSAFWRETHRMLGAKLLMSTVFRPQTDGASEHAIRTVTQILRTMVQPDQKDWVTKVPMVKFAINSSISSSTGFAPFELNYGHMPRIMECVGDRKPSEAPGVQTFVRQALENLVMAHNTIIESWIAQAYHANKRKGVAPKFEVGDLVYLLTQNLSMPKGCVRKLIPKYIGPIKVLRQDIASDTYTLDLPTELKAHQIHPTFHVGVLRQHKPNDDALFPKRDAQAFYNMGNKEKVEWIIDEILAHQWTANKVEFLVRWNLGDSTWEPYAHCKDLEALDRYLEIQGVESVRHLPRRDRDLHGNRRLREQSGG